MSIENALRHKFEIQKLMLDKGILTKNQIREILLGD